jgi:hypothetical protein
MKRIGFVDGVEIIENILRHLGLWEMHNHDPPVPGSVHILELVYDHSESQISVFDY